MTAKSGFTSPLGTQVYINSGVLGVTFNFVQDTGSANTLAGTLTNIDGSSITLASGLRVLVKANNTLQAGANTFNLNAGGAVNIKNINSNNLKTTTAAGALLDMVYDGTNWVILNSTY